MTTAMPVPRRSAGRAVAPWWDKSAASPQTNATPSERATRPPAFARTRCSQTPPRVTMATPARSATSALAEVVVRGLPWTVRPCRRSARKAIAPTVPVPRGRATRAVRAALREPIHAARRSAVVGLAPRSPSTAATLATVKPRSASVAPAERSVLPTASPVVHPRSARSKSARAEVAVQSAPTMAMPVACH